jgi:catechol 2,3-dioxygenase-like lactoylglutathione lyase family enzyme
MKPKIDHIQITVKDFNKAEKFYDKLMPILGFDLTKKGKGRVEAHDFDVIEYYRDDIIIGINSPREKFEKDEVHRRKPGSLHHLAFNAGSNHNVDKLFGEILNIDAVIVETPKFFPQHGEKYYACFFKDPDGIKFEIMYEEK